MLHKERDPSTHAWAAARVIELVGATAAAEAIERSASLIYHWADPDNPAQPVLWQAQVLDRLCAEHGETPFRSVWDRRNSAIKGKGVCPLELAIQVDQDATDLVASVHEALKDRKIDAHERMEIGQITARARAVLDAIDAELRQHITAVS